MIKLWLTPNEQLSTEHITIYVIIGDKLSLGEHLRSFCSLKLMTAQLV